MRFHVAIDVGGTFTDLVCVEGDSRITSFKSPTTPVDVVNGTFDVLELCARHYDMTLEQFLGGVLRFVYSSTTATNALLTGTAAKTGLICTKGFRDVLLIREGGKRETFDIAMDYPEPYVPRYLTLEVTERINAEGGIEIDLCNCVMSTV